MSTSLAPSADTLMVKTAKGSAEVGTREHRLGPRLRTILIMVDGRLTWAEITARAAALGNAPVIVGHLLNEGFIEPAGTGAPAAAGPPSVPPRAPLAPAQAAPAATPRMPPAPPPSALPAAEPLEKTQRLRTLDPATAPGTAADTSLAQTIRMPTLALEQGVDEATRHLVTELTRSGNLVTLRGDALSGMRESEATGPARFYMHETMGRLLGGGAIGVLDNIDLATTRERLLAELANCAQIIKDLKGQAEADSFRISVLALLPE